MKKFLVLMICLFSFFLSSTSLKPKLPKPSCSPNKKIPPCPSFRPSGKSTTNPNLL
jgi:hypothetical protein